MDQNICSISECGSRAVAKGLCSKHYQRLRTHGDVNHARPIGCKVVGCNRDHWAKELCRSHYYNFKKHGDPLHQSKPQVVLPCSVDGCDLDQHAKTLCKKHYRRKWKTGSTEWSDSRGRARRGSGLKFLQQAQEAQTDECIEWPYGRQSRQDYGQSWRNGKPIPASRHSLILATGKEPADLHARHSCNNPICVNPRHLKWGTPMENRVHDRLENDTYGSKLDKETVRKIYAAAHSGRSQKDVAEEFGITPKRVGQIKRGETWARVTGCGSCD